MGKQRKFGLIGGGNMGEALIKGLIQSGIALPAEIIVSEPLDERRDYLRNEYQIAVESDNKALVIEAPVIILAVKPQVMEKVLNDIQARVEPNHLIITIAAGVKVETIQSVLPSDTPVIRAMPNTPALALSGATAIAPGSHAGKEHLEVARTLFEAVGIVVEVEEKNMDAVTALSGSGPAYVFVFMEALTDAGVLEGLPRDQAFLLACQTILGSAKLAKEAGVSPAQLKDKVTSPAGTTITGLMVLEKGGLRGLIMEAVQAASKRSAELGE
ncbi:MAG: pyrroline-5-carboxylate reductase [Deltaproteobacteria bacterium]|nr:pyrroline-5-carboxylate reductase [Deltaproteobacteria bacterium]